MSEPAQAREALYTHPLPRGNRVPGWDALNVAELARQTGASGQHLRQVLAGRSNATTELLQLIAQRLEMGLGELLERIEGARVRDKRRKAGEKLFTVPLPDNNASVVTHPEGVFDMREVPPAVYGYDKTGRTWELTKAEQVRRRRLLRARLSQTLDGQ